VLRMTFVAETGSLNILFLSHSAYLGLESWTGNWET